MACNRLRNGFMLSLPSVVLSRDDDDLLRTKVDGRSSSARVTPEPIGS
jgi:hypothetical protein